MAERDDDDRLPDRFDYIEARLKRLEQQLGLDPLELRQFFADWHTQKREKNPAKIDPEPGS